jgi:hypothetical protein
MTAAQQKPLTVPTTNGAKKPPAAPAKPSTDQRITALEQQVARLAAGVAQLLAQQMQPQVQQAILKQLNGG